MSSSPGRSVRSGRRISPAASAGDFDTAVVWAGEDVDLIGDVPPAAEIVHRIGADAERRLAMAATWIA